MDRVRSKPLCVCVCVRALTEAAPRVNVRTIALSGCFTRRRLRRHRLNCIVMRVCMYVRRDGKLARPKSIRNVDNEALEGTCFLFFSFFFFCFFLTRLQANGVRALNGKWSKRNALSETLASLSERREQKRRTSKGS